MLSLPPQKFREIVFQLLYSSDFGSDPSVIKMIMTQLSVTKKAMRLAEEMVNKILIHSEGLEALIENYVKEYSLERIPRVERTVLRLGLYELLIDKQQPYKVVIAETIRLTKKFATKEAALFVNAVIDCIYKQSKEGKSLVHSAATSGE